MCGCSTESSTCLYYGAYGLTCSNDSGAFLSYYAKVAGEYIAVETLPDGVTESDLMSSTAYVTAKRTGLAAVLSMRVSDVTITGFTITSADPLHAAVRQLLSHVAVTTSFTVDISGHDSAASITDAITGASATLEVMGEERGREEEEEKEEERMEGRGFLAVGDPPRRHGGTQLGKLVRLDPRRGPGTNFERILGEEGGGLLRMQGTS